MLGKDSSAGSMNKDILKAIIQSFLKFQRNKTRAGLWGVRLNDTGASSAGEIC